jgi:hypothetical protein
MNLQIGLGKQIAILLAPGSKRNTAVIIYPLLLLPPPPRKRSSDVAAITACDAVAAPVAAPSRKRSSLQACDTF